MPNVVTGSHEKGYILFDNDTILLKDVRCVYVHVGSPFKGRVDKVTGKKGEDKFSARIMIDKSGQDKHKQLLEREINKLLDGKLGTGKRLKDDALCLKDGDREGKDFMRGQWIVNVNEKVNRPPALRDFDGAKVSAEGLGEAKIDAMFVGGYYYDVLMKIWWQDNDYGKKVNGNLLAMKLVRKAEPIGNEGGITDDDVDDAFGLEKGDAGFGSDDDL